MKSTSLTWEIDPETGTVEFIYGSGVRVTTWTLRNEDDTLDILLDIVDVVTNGMVKPGATTSLAYIEPAIGLSPTPVAVSQPNITPEWAATAKQGVSWDDEDGVDQLPVM